MGDFWQESPPGAHRRGASPGPVGSAAADDTPPPTGAPPRLGVIDASGAVTRWAGDVPEVVARLPGGRAYQAVGTAYGIVVTHSTGTLLIRPDGAIVVLLPGTGSRVVCGDGHRVAVVRHLPGAAAEEELHLIDLAGGASQVLRAPAAGPLITVVAVAAGTVYFDGGPAGPTGMRWTPGARPEPMPFRLTHIDPVSLTRLAAEPGGVRLMPAAGPSRRVEIGETVALVPGAGLLYAVRAEPPGIARYDAGEPAPRPHVVALPDCPAPSSIVPLFWESPAHLLLHARRRGPVRASPIMRFDIWTGEISVVPLPAGAWRGPVLIEPAVP
jgi:hypothetical protein